MKHADLTTLKETIEGVLRQSPLADQFKEVSVEEGMDDADHVFLRVVLHLAEPEKVEWKTISPIVRDIEDAVAENDDRFPSIRLAEAA